MSQQNDGGGGCDKHGKVVAAAPIGEHVDGAEFDPGAGQAFFSNGDGTLTIVQEDALDAYHVVDTKCRRKSKGQDRGTGSGRPIDYSWRMPTSAPSRRLRRTIRTRVQRSFRGPLRSSWWGKFGK